MCAEQKERADALMEGKGKMLIRLNGLVGEVQAMMREYSQGGGELVPSPSRNA